MEQIDVSSGGRRQRSVSMQNIRLPTVARWALREESIQPAEPVCDGSQQNGHWQHVVDHEQIVGISEGTVEAIAVYRVDGGQISTTWFY